MPKEFEVELRGRLQPDEAEALVMFLGENGTAKTEKRRVLIDYSTFLEGGVRDRRKDIRIRNTNGKPEIIIKLGSWGNNESREEISIPTEQEVAFDQLAHAMNALGYSKGVLAVRNSKVYDYKGAEFAVVEVPGHSYYFEAEKVVSDGDQAQALDELSRLCKEMQLNIFEGNGFYEYIEELNKEANEVYDAVTAEPHFFEEKFGI